MASENLKLICAAALALMVSGCGSGGDGDGVDQPLPVDNGADEITLPEEPTDDIQVDSGEPTPITPSSSTQMSSYIENPLLSDVPGELDGSVVAGKPRSFITNPLLD